MSCALIPLTVPQRPTLRVVAVPGAGAGPGTFEPWRRLVPHSWQLSAVCLPGRGTRFGEPFATDMRELARELAGEIAATEDPVSPVPLLMFGHSMGALVAFETAALLQPRCLAVAGCAPPASPRRRPYGSTAEADVARAIRGLVASLGVGDPDLFEELVALSTPVLLADLALLDGYRPQQTRVDCELLAMYGRQDDLEPESWSASSTAGSSLQLFAGGHFFVQHQAADVVRALATALSGSAGGQHPAVASSGRPQPMTPDSLCD